MIIKNLVLQTDFWNVVLGKDQTYFGYCVVLLRRDCPNLSMISREELLDFHQVVKSLESALRATTNATMFNWMCLMNDAYKKTPYSPQVHWHLQPRYDHEVTFAGNNYNDPNFGNYPFAGTNQAIRVLSDDLMDALTQAIKSNLRND